MKTIRFLALACLTLTVSAAIQHSEQFGKTPPQPRKQLEKFIVNLDLPPEQRWVDLVKEKKTSIKLLLDALRLLFNTGKSKDTTQKIVAAVNSSLSDEHRREMQGISDAIGAPLSDCIMANAYYEISGVSGAGFDAVARSCTSMAVQRANGTVFLARNQDYPPPFSLVQHHAIFQRGGKTLFEGTGFAGTIGLATGQVPGEWAVSINARGGANSPDLPTALKLAREGASLFPLATREAMEVNGGSMTTFSDALSYFTSHNLIMPGYLIVAGKDPGQGAIVTRNSTAAAGGADVFRLNNAHGTDEAGGKWYVVQTNTDHWVHASNYPGFHTSRRATATAALDKITAADVDLDQLWSVLSTKPVYNAATIHTELVAPAWGEYRTFKRHGPL